MTGTIIIIVLVLGGLWFLASTEGPDDPDITHECNVDQLVRDSLRKPKEVHHRHSSAPQMYRRP